MTLKLTSDVAAGLASLAAARGLSIEQYLRSIVVHELAATPVAEIQAEEGSGMVFENGMLINGAGTALPAAVVDDAIRLSREERSQHLLGNLS